MSIKRYDLCHIGSGIHAMMDDSDGEFVKHEDYAALEQQLAESQREFRSADATIENLQMQLKAEREAKMALAAENAGLKAGVTYFACGSEYGFDLFKNKHDAIDTALGEIDIHREGYLDGDGWDDGVKRTVWGIVIQSAQGYDAQGKHTSDSQHTYQTCDYRLVDEVDTPATDAFVAEVRDSAIPEGYVLVPQEMHLSSEAMEVVCFHCGDGGHQLGELINGTLFVGEVDYGDGEKVHGLHIATADYPEEGCATICEFAAQLRKGVQS